MTVQFFEVGGAVRDRLLGLRSKDVDFVCVAASFEAMRQHLVETGFTVYVEKPEFVTIRAGVPQGHALRSRTKDADFVLARRDSATSDGRRPDFVEAGTLSDDLARRDFTVNALAIDPVTEAIIDEHGGLDDIKSRTLRFVGDPFTRIQEDGLRVLRGFRFMITRQFACESRTMQALVSLHAAERLGCVSAERVREELERMFACDTLATLRLLQTLPEHTLNAIFRDRIRLCATMRN